MLFTKGGSGNKVVGNEDDGKGGDSIDFSAPKSALKSDPKKAPSLGQYSGAS